MNREELRRLAKAATKGATLERYRNGGGRLAILGIPRELVADFFNERDREFYAAANPAAVLDLLDQLDAAEARLAAIEATDKSKLSIQYGWLVYDVGEHTCGGYGPESGYMHEPGCGYEPLFRLDELTGWPGGADA